MKVKKNTKYFYSLEKANYNAKTCYAIYNTEGDDTLIYDQDEIIKIQKQFYDSLYTADPEVHFDLRNTHGIFVKDDERLKQDSAITLDELKESVFAMSKNKTPGNDGLSADFYQTFWNDIQLLFLNMTNEVYNEGMLHDTALQGILNLIPKPNKDSRNIKNLRPITLLNTDYKIIEKVIANRIMPSLHDIIHGDQRGFMPNRRISVNIRKLLDIIFFAVDNDLECLIVSLDFAKCFDRVEFGILHGSLKYFQFGQVIQKWTHILYSNFNVRIQNNGHFSDKIEIKRGIHQGGCCSSLYFLIVAEILALELRSNPHISGIVINSIKNVLNQFADDLDLFSENRKTSLEAIFQTLEFFKSQSGFSISYDKTTVYRTGSLRFADATLYDMSQVAWTSDDIKVLGTIIAKDNILEKNFSSTLTQARQIMNNWTNRPLSLLGKVNIVNTLVASLFVYKMLVLPSMSDSMHKTINNDIVNFLWNGKKPKIALKILQSDKKSGGLQLVNLRLREKALKASWVKILYNEQQYSKVVYSMLEPVLEQNIWRCTLEKNDVKHLGIKNDFWKQVTEAWFEFSFDKSVRVIENQIIWWNSCIRIEDKPFVWKHLFKRGLIYVNQLYNSEGRVKAIVTLAREFGMSIMELNSIVTALPTAWRDFFRENAKASYLPIRPHVYDQAVQNCKLSATIYKEFVENPFCCLNKQQKWEQTLETQISLYEFTKMCNDIYTITNIPKYRSFQYRLLQHSLITNVHLHEWKISETDLCTFCKKYPENWKHLFYECKEVANLWERLAEQLQARFLCQIQCTYYNILFNRIAPRSHNVCNFICLATKQFIYSKRCLKKALSFQELELKILHLERIEKYVAVTNGKTEKNQKKWFPNSHTN